MPKTFASLLARARGSIECFAFLGMSRASMDTIRSAEGKITLECLTLLMKGLLLTMTEPRCGSDYCKTWWRFSQELEHRITQQ